MKVFGLVLVIVASVASAVPASQYKLTATANLGIVNGKDALPNQFPYQVSVQLKNSLGIWKHTCGGSVIGKNYVLTAASCIATNTVASDYRVVAGITNLNDAESQTVQISNITVHELFPGGLVIAPNDIALLGLATLLEWNDSVKPISLPAAGYNISSGDANLSGWGSIVPDGTKIPTALQFAEVPIVENTECNNLIKKITSLPQTPFDSEANLCTGSSFGFQAACNADQGSPLESDRRLIGIVSWGITPCATASGAPTVYTRVSNYVTWIQEKTADLQ